MKMKCPSSLSRAPPRWVIGTSQLGRLRSQAEPITPPRGRHTVIWLRVYDPIFVVSIRAWVLYESPGKARGIVMLLCGQAEARIRSARGSYMVINLAVIRREGEMLRYFLETQI